MTANSSSRPTRKKFPFSFENFLTIFAFIFAYGLIEAIYRFIVNPRVELFYAKDSSPGATSTWIILDGYEQQLTLVLFFLSLSILFYKFILVFRERNMLTVDVIGLGKGSLIHREEASVFALGMEENLPADMPPPLSFAFPSLKNSLVFRAFRKGLDRFNDTRERETNEDKDDLGDVREEISQTISNVCESELSKLESQLAMINYIAWAIPSVGFIGTVRGIGAALAKADMVGQEGGLGEVTGALGLAFNSTLVSLLVSMVLMFLIYVLKRMQEGLVMESEEYCQERLLSHI
ncbi:MotA/TolQ/ExbB proton channel family protein [Puniceicoccaceae bacterium K14]|nr:MotA/TolQ/ExbB proton channel family protein [Puniceicoccaceae bacterium K14]